MSDADDRNSQASAIPSWQQAQNSEAQATVPENDPAPDTEKEADIETPIATETNSGDLEVARRFLEDETVKSSSRERKIEFLQAKGIADADIQTLLGDDATSFQNTQNDERSITSDEVVTQQPDVTRDTAPSSVSTPTTTQSSIPQQDRAPIITYPEFLAQPARPPPLITTDRLLNTLYALTGLSTLVYGTGKYVLTPMIESQTEARYEFHDSTAEKLNALVAKLEKTVSEVPSKKTAPQAATVQVEESDAEDPAELFHRDMGTQTTFPSTSYISTTNATKGNETTASKRHADQLIGLNKKLTGLTDRLRSQSEDIDQVKAIVDGFRDDLDTLTFEGKGGDVLGGNDTYGRPSKTEPDNEMRKVRDSIRRVKGVLLSTRNFPMSR